MVVPLNVPASLSGHGYPSRPFPRGVHDDVPGTAHVEDTVNVSVYAPELDEVEVWFFDVEGQLRSEVLDEETDGAHHGAVHGLRHGARYAFWPAGTELPASGQLFIDPYARAIEEDEHGVYWGIYVAQKGFDWGEVKRPHIPWRDTIIYEAHVKGLTALHPDVPEELRGTYAGLAHPAMIDHLRGLGVTAVELLPIQFHIDEPHLRELGMPNYWGYNTLGYFAPHHEYASKAAQAAGPHAVQDEIKGMIKHLHAAGIEVVLDVVFNHTAEGGQSEGALSWRGLADHHYYRHDANGNYVDTTGCGNTLNPNEPAVIRMAIDSLRYWVEEFQVDGFRFDLAVSLGRDNSLHFTPDHPFLAAILASETLQDVKMIAEPWDVSLGGWQTGRFPRGFADWNDTFRDTVRDFWVADHGLLSAGAPGSSVAKLATVLGGSRELFAQSARGALASVNFVTAHDGFTLRDLVSYDRKHNEANGEENRDGHNHNRSFNHGVEGQTADDAVNAERLKTASNVMATLLLSLGVPMITAGDEMGKTQGGNNNAYCQDNETSWLHWDLSADQRAMLETTRALIKIRREFLASQPYTYPAQEDSGFLHWFNAAGEVLTQEQWVDPATRVMQLRIGSPEGGLDGLVVFNGTLAPVELTLPHAPELDGEAGTDGTQPVAALQYNFRFSTDPSDRDQRDTTVASGGTFTVAANSIGVFRC